MKKRKIRITPNDQIAKALEKYPEIEEVFWAYGLSCVGCGVSSCESIEQGAKSHGLTPCEIQEMLESMNEMLEQ